MKVVTLDSQILTAIMKCDRYAEYSFIRNLTSSVKSTALDKGDVVHVCLETLYKLKSENNHAEYMDMVELAAQIGQEHSYGLDAPMEICMESIKTFKQYAEYYKGDDWIPLKIEHVFAKELYADTDIQIIYQGKIDLVVDSIAGIQVVDHKTTSRRTDPLFLQNQFIGYAWALETPNICINEVGFQKTLPPTEKFRRLTFSYPKELIEEWVHMAAYHVKIFVAHTESGFFPPRYTSCRGVYGDCLFIPICVSTPESRDWKMETMYSKRTWDVGAKLEEGGDKL